MASSSTLKAKNSIRSVTRNDSVKTDTMPPKPLSRAPTMKSESRPSVRRAGSRVDRSPTRRLSRDVGDKIRKRDSMRSRKDSIRSNRTFKDSDDPNHNNTTNKNQYDPDRTSPDIMQEIYNPYDGEETDHKLDLSDCEARPNEIYYEPHPSESFRSNYNPYLLTHNTRKKSVEIKGLKRNSVREKIRMLEHKSKMERVPDMIDIYS